MKISNVILAVAIILLALGGLVFFALQKNKAENGQEAASYKNLSYTLDNQSVKLVEGVSETPAAPGSATMVSTKYFGNEAFGDLNGDGNQDVAFILTQQSGGSGVFYYLAAALATGNGYQPVQNTIFLGDRIAPQTSQVNNAMVVVSYADRNPGDSMASPPTVVVSKSFRVEGSLLVPASNFEASPMPSPTLSTSPFITPSPKMTPVTTPARTPTPTPYSGTAFGTAITFTMGKKVTFADGLTMTLKSIGDSRCSSGVQCVWAGELNPKFAVSGGAVGTNKDFNFGTTTSTKISTNGYTFTLTGATTTTATIVVSK